MRNRRAGPGKYSRKLREKNRNRTANELVVLSVSSVQIIFEALRLLFFFLFEDEVFLFVCVSLFVPVLVSVPVHV